MKFTYKPAGTSEAQWKVWVVDPKKLLNVESELIEDKTGMTFIDWHNGVMQESARAIHGLLWVLLRRDTPDLPYEAVEFAYNDYELDLDDEQQADLLARLEQAAATGDLTPEGELQLEELRVRFEDVDAPKASPEPNSEPDTSGTSPTYSTPLEPISIS